MITTQGFFRALCLFGLMIFGGVAAAATLSIGGPTPVQRGQLLVSYDITLTDGMGVSSMGLFVDYDHTVFQISSVGFGGFADEVGRDWVLDKNTDTDGKVNMSINDWDFIGINSNAATTLATLTFNVLPDAVIGKTDLEFSFSDLDSRRTNLVDFNILEVTFDSVNYPVTVQLAAVPIPPAWLLFATGMVLMRRFTRA